MFPNLCIHVNSLIKDVIQIWIEHNRSKKTNSSSAKSKIYCLNLFHSAASPVVPNALIIFLDDVFRKGKAVFQSDNIGALAFVKEFISSEATVKNIQLSITMSVCNEASIAVVRRIHPQLLHLTRQLNDIKFSQVFFPRILLFKFVLIVFNHWIWEMDNRSKFNIKFEVITRIIEWVRCWEAPLRLNWLAKPKALVTLTRIGWLIDLPTCFKTSTPLLRFQISSAS